MHPSHIPQCIIQNRNVPIPVLNGALRDMGHCGICEIGLRRDGISIHLTLWKLDPRFHEIPMPLLMTKLNLYCETWVFNYPWTCSSMHVWWENCICWHITTLLWRHNRHNGVSNHQPRDCLFKRLFRRRSKKTPKAPRHRPLCVEFTGVSIWWRQHDIAVFSQFSSKSFYSHKLHILTPECR